MRSYARAMIESVGYVAALNCNTIGEYALHKYFINFWGEVAMSSLGTTLGTASEV